MTRKEAEQKRIPPSLSDRALERLLQDISLTDADTTLTEADKAMFEMMSDSSKTRSIFYRTFS